MEAKDIKSVLILSDNDWDNLLDIMNTKKIEVMNLLEMPYILDHMSIYSLAHTLIDNYGYSDVKEVVEYLNKNEVTLLYSNTNFKSYFRNTNICFVNIESDIRKYLRIVG